MAIDAEVAQQAARERTPSLQAASHEPKSLQPPKSPPAPFAVCIDGGDANKSTSIDKGPLKSGSQSESESESRPLSNMTTQKQQEDSNAVKGESSTVVSTSETTEVLPLPVVVTDQSQEKLQASSSTNTNGPLPRRTARRRSQGPDTESESTTTTTAPTESVPLASTTAENENDPHSLTQPAPTPTAVSVSNEDKDNNNLVNFDSGPQEPEVAEERSQVPEEQDAPQAQAALTQASANVNTNANANANANASPGGESDKEHLAAEATAEAVGAVEPLVDSNPTNPTSPTVEDSLSSLLETADNNRPETIDTGTAKATGTPTFQLRDDIAGIERMIVERWLRQLRDPVCRKRSLALCWGLQQSLRQRY